MLPCNTEKQSEGCKEGCNGLLPIHYDTGKVFLLRFLTHAEYDKDRWKTEL